MGRTSLLLPAPRISISIKNLVSDCDTGLTATINILLYTFFFHGFRAVKLLLGNAEIGLQVSSSQFFSRVAYSALSTPGFKVYNGIPNSSPAFLGAASISAASSLFFSNRKGRCFLVACAFSQLFHSTNNLRLEFLLLILVFDQRCLTERDGLHTV